MDSVSYLADVIDRWYPDEYNAMFESMMVDAYFGKGGGYCIGVNSGTSALLAALAGVGVGAGDEVILPAFTFSAPAFAVEQLGAKCVFVDIERTTWNISTKRIESAITSKTKAIIVVHLYGLPADMPSIMELARHYNLEVIEDCAEAFYASIHGQYVGTFGDAAIFSFEKSKHITAGGGGAVITRNPKYAERIRKFSILGYSTLGASGTVGTKEDVQHPSFNRHYTFGYNFKLPELCAAVLCSQLEEAQKLVDMRIRNAEIYSKGLTNYYTVADKMQTQFVPIGFNHTYWTYAFLLPGSSDPTWTYEMFRRGYFKFGGHKFYAGWKCVPDEPYFRKTYSVDPRSYQVSRDVQEGVICLNTGFEDVEYVKVQAELLAEGLRAI